ncbi:MAG: DUF5009 domain-containing protein [Ignavibacteriae bacterium]|nr:DUF5009 domain-containing protein [Ignavibacteriota bacterium]NOG96671.1 DUF5009 domain-containing protein [Ignavibacteriota bacterium]
MIETKKNKIISSRIKSIDIFRGLTIFLMIFVNDLISVSNITYWLKHMPADESGMTIPDIVFPAFLFIVGMSIPLAFKKRLSLGESKIKIILHILIRSAALLILGILMVNIGRLNEDLTGMPRNLWSLLMFISVILLWNTFPADGKLKRRIYFSLKIIGACTLIILMVIFRSGTADEPTWLATSWWGILGLIGWAYLASSIIYLFAKDNITTIIAAIGICIAVYIGDHSGAFDFLIFNKSFLLIGPHLAGHATITLSGVLLTLLFSKNGFLAEPNKKIKQGILFALTSAIIGYCLHPLYGVSKIYTTPAFSLYSVSICVLSFLILYWIVDLKKKGELFRIFDPAGSNPLLTYILPSIIYSIIAVIGLSSYMDFWREGILGVLRSIIFSFLILWITYLMTKINIKLKL